MMIRNIYECHWPIKRNNLITVKGRRKVAEEYETRREGRDHESEKGDPPVQQELN